jgi:hypothetical protein
MRSFRTKLGAAGAVTAVAAAGLGFVPAAHGDEQYRADRAYCMSGQASEARDLCLKEAAAAQADRQRGSHDATHHGHRRAKSEATASPEKSASAP